MKLTNLPFALLLLICGGTLRSMAQQDTTHLDIGYLTLKKEFTQQISIKGSDLEQMPFMNLSDAIAVWLYGAYSTPATLQYVVDGNPVADVNAYSIHEIEEVTLVQHAAGLIATAPGQAELVVIRTKRGVGPGSITAAAQTGLITMKASNYVNTITTLFHNYYIGGYRNAGKVSYGLSANFIRDAMPFSYDETIVTPENWQRWRLNGYLDWRPDAHNQIEVTLNYTTQQLGGRFDTAADGASAEVENGYQHFVLPHLDWRGEWAKGFVNDLQATYLRDHVSTGNATEQKQAPDSFQIESFGFAAKSYHLWVRDHLVYSVKAGDWAIEPALNLSYEHINEQQGEAEEFQNITGGFYSLGSGGVISSAYYTGRKSNIFLVTPGLDVSYKRVFDLQGGAMIYPGTGSLTANGKKVYPYAGVTLDLLRLGDGGRESSLKLFGSVASRAEPSYNGYGLEGYSSGRYSSANQPVFNGNYTLTGTGGGVGSQPEFVLNGPVPYWTWETGARYSGLKGRLELSYAFEHRIFTGYDLLQQLSSGEFVVSFPEYRASLHHLDMRVKVIDGGGISWRTGVNITVLRSRVNLDSPYVGSASAGDLAPNPWSWTGGWVNRLQVRDFVAGLDLLYHFNETQGSGLAKKNSVVTPNIYAGYRFHFSHGTGLEVFIDGRRLIASKTQDIMDQRKLYSLGGKLTI